MNVVIDGKAVKDAVDKHEKDRKGFHSQLLQLNPDDLRCGICGYPLKKARMTYESCLTIKIRSKMTMPMTVETKKGIRGYTREFQKELHKGIAEAIVSAVERQRDDNSFDSVALDDLYIDASEFGIKGEPEISDFADIRLTYHSGKKTWIGEVLMTKAEREGNQESGEKQVK